MSVPSAENTGADQRTTASRVPLMRRAGRALIATAAATALAAGLTPSIANAQEVGTLSPESVANDALGTFSPESLSQLLYFGNLPGSSGSSMMGIANTLGFSPNMFAGPPPPSPQPNPNITEKIGRAHV